MVANFFEKNFSSIAVDLGPKAVIVGPHDRAAEQYISSVAEIRMNGCILCQGSWETRDQMTKYFHNGQPYLIITKGALNPKGDNNDALVLNLASIPNEGVLAQLFSQLMDAIHAGNLEKFVNEFEPWERSYEPSKLDQYTSSLELRPNLFGIGIDLRKLLKQIQSGVKRDQKRSD